MDGIYFGSYVSKVTLALATASFSFTGKAVLGQLAASLTKPTFTFTGKDVLCQLAASLTKPTFTFTAKAASPYNWHQMSAPVVSFDAYGVTLYQTQNETSATFNWASKPIDEPATLGLTVGGMQLISTSGAVQLTQTVNPSASSFTFTPKPMAYGGTSSLILALGAFTIAARDITNKNVLQLGSATLLLQVANAGIDLYLDGVVIPGRLKMRPLTGVGL